MLAPNMLGGGQGGPGNLVNMGGMYGGRMPMPGQMPGMQQPPMANPMHPVGLQPPQMQMPGQMPMQPPGQMPPMQAPVASPRFPMGNLMSMRGRY